MSAIKRAFTLIELILVIFLISLVSFLVIKLPSYSKTYTFKDIRALLYPGGELYIDKNSVYIIKNGKKKKINFRYSEFQTYDNNFNPLKFKNHLFVYKMKNGVGDSLIIKEKKVYFFKPLWVREFSSLKDAKDYMNSLNEALK